MSETFSVEVETRGKVWIFTSHGYINNQGGEAIAQAYHQAQAEGATIYLLNLADSRIVNSIGVSVLIELLEETLDRGHCMAFCACVPIVAKTFQIMGLTQYAAMYDTLALALVALNQ